MCPSRSLRSWKMRIGPTHLGSSRPRARSWEREIADGRLVPDQAGHALGECSMTHPKKALRLPSALWAVILTGAGGNPPGGARVFQVRLDRGHPWRPPFGLERVGRPITAVVEAAARPESARLVLVCLRN